MGWDIRGRSNRSANFDHGHINHVTTQKNRTLVGVITPSYCYAATSRKYYGLYNSEGSFIGKLILERNVFYISECFPLIYTVFVT